MRSKTVFAAAAAAAMALGLGVAEAAPKCANKMFVGTWAATDYEPGDEADDVDLCLMQLNTKGQIMAYSCFEATDAKPIRQTQNTTGRLTVTKACEVTGTVRQGKRARTVTGTLDPVKGVLTLTVKGDDTPVVFNQQW